MLPKAPGSLLSLQGLPPHSRRHTIPLTPPQMQLFRCLYILSQQGVRICGQSIPTFFKRRVWKQEIAREMIRLWPQTVPGHKQAHLQSPPCQILSLSLHMACAPPSPLPEAAVCARLSLHTGCSTENSVRGVSAPVAGASMLLCGSYEAGAGK